MNEVELIKRIAVDAGKTILKHWRRGNKADVTSNEKFDGSPVSEADFASNELIVSALKKNFPSDSIVSEEMPRPDSFQDRVWIIDPLDGTKSFLSGIDDFSVLIGLVEGGKPKLGVMYFPARETLAYAEIGHGAFLNGRKTSVSSSEQINGVYIRNFEPKDRDVKASPPMDSGLALLQVASGILEGGIIKMTTHREWDLAAPTAIIQEAGGKVSDEKGEDLMFLSNPFSPKYVIASNGLVHKELLALIK